MSSELGAHAVPAGVGFGIPQREWSRNLPIAEARRGLMIVALEEHYFDADWNAYADAPRHTARPDSPFLRRISDLDQLRLKEMDEAGIDLQVISHAPPGAQGVKAEAAVSWAHRANDRLYAAIQRHPTRFAGFAAGADELERAVTELGFKGAMINSLTEGPFLDDRRYWPIFERAQALDVPIYLHPADPNPAIMSAYYRGYAETHPMFVRAGWGFMVETGTQAMRLILSGIFDVYPDLKIVLGHLGETIPYQIARIDEALSRDTPMKNFREVFSRHFYVTTSGFFSTPAVQCCIDEIGIDRILFSIDWPYASNKAGVEWLKSSRLADDEKAAIFSGNAKRLLKL
jgi:predicted TIM-barrel fold metal-dependent hydrolase